MRYAQLVIGLAGSGKSTYCKDVFEHCQSIGRTVHVVNLDPAADHFEYPSLLVRSSFIHIYLCFVHFVDQLKRWDFNVCTVYKTDSQFLTLRFRKLNHALAELVDDHSMINFVPLDIRKEDNIEFLLSCIDNCIQYGEGLEPKLKDCKAEDIDD